MNLVQQANENSSTQNDKVIYTLKGTNGQLYVYENKIVISRKGVIAFMNHGLKGSKTIPISQIKSVQVKSSKLTAGYIQFGVGGGLENVRGLQQAASDENSITFPYRYNNLVNDIKTYIENIMLKQNDTSTSSNVSISIADEIKGFKELLDMGAITQDEFDAKKKQLLGL